jgi:hypothetical protein
MYKFTKIVVLPSVGGAVLQCCRAHIWGKHPRRSLFHIWPVTLILTIYSNRHCQCLYSPYTVILTCTAIPNIHILRCHNIYTHLCKYPARRMESGTYTGSDPVYRPVPTYTYYYALQLEFSVPFITKSPDSCCFETLWTLLLIYMLVAPSHSLTDFQQLTSILTDWLLNLFLCDDIRVATPVGRPSCCRVVTNYNT